MEITKKLKERFCKDCNIPIKIFDEPYFTDRLWLFDRFYNTLEKWELFVEELQKYNSEQEYFEEYNRVKDEAISSIKNTLAYQRFNVDDMNRFRVKYNNLPNKDIFKPSNDGKTFISIDMKKANFSALSYYNKNIFSNAETWEEFISSFTNNQHIINSKYIRQVILGNCNPKRHITYEKYLMDYALSVFLKQTFSIDRVVFFSNDEIVIDVSDMTTQEQLLLLFQINVCKESIPIPLKAELFTLYKIHGTDGYCKKITNEHYGKEIEFKCLNNYLLPFVARYFLNEEVSANDKVFYHEGLLAQFVDVPEIEVERWKI